MLQSLLASPNGADIHKTRGPWGSHGLVHGVGYLRFPLCGPGKLDRQIDQLELKLEELQIAHATVDVLSSPQRAREKRKPARRPLPPDLPRVE
jgi:hypothetical protein